MLKVFSFKMLPQPLSTCFLLPRYRLNIPSVATLLKVTICVPLPLLPVAEHCAYRNLTLTYTIMKTEAIAFDLTSTLKRTLSGLILKPMLLLLQVLLRRAQWRKSMTTCLLITCHLMILWTTLLLHLLSHSLIFYHSTHLQLPLLPSTVALVQEATLLLLPVVIPFLLFTTSEVKAKRPSNTISKKL